MTPREALTYLDAQYEVACPARVQRLAIRSVLDRPQFSVAPAAQKKHHAYTGGLVIHTAEVLKACLATAVAFPEADKAVLTCAAIFHDCEKIRDYEPNLVMDKVSGALVQTVDDEHPGGWRYTDFASKIKHVAGSYATWDRTARIFGVEQDFTDAVSHCILAHHGRKEWGSPVEPQTVEALILHSADMLSAYYGAGRQVACKST